MTAADESLHELSSEEGIAYGYQIVAYVTQFPSSSSAACDNCENEPV